MQVTKIFQKYIEITVSLLRVHGITHMYSHSIVLKVSDMPNSKYAQQMI